MPEIRESERGVGSWCGETDANSLARARDRVLLYTRGMGVEPLLSVELALESMRRAASDGTPLPGGEDVADGADPATVVAMEGLRALFAERGIVPYLPDADGKLLRSMPPMNRRPMIAEEMDRSLLRRAARGLLRLLGLGRAS